MIELRNISKYYGDEEAVCNLSLHIKEGETLGLIGTSGCGKTTTLRMINRLTEPSSGTIKINGEDTGSQAPEKLRRQMGYVIQDVGLFPHYTVQQNITIVPRLLKWEESDRRSRSRELLELVGLNPNTFSDRMPATLSGGQQQRVGLARALAADPPIILMDEPFGALDPITKRQIRGEIGRIFKEINKTIVLVTHDVFEAFEMCDRLCLLDDGVVQQVGTPKELLFRPANGFVNSFFDANHLQLEMMCITIKDILDIVHNFGKLERHPDKDEGLGTGQAEGDVPAIKLENSFFEAFEQVGNNIIQIIDDNGRVCARLSDDDLLKGFHAVRRNLKEE